MALFHADDYPSMPEMVKNLKGLLFADKGYIKQALFDQLYQIRLKMVTGLKKSMKPKFMLWWDKVLLRKRTVIESVFNILKNMFKLEHTRHRSTNNALVHLTSTLLAYCFKTNKPAIKFNHLIQN